MKITEFTVTGTGAFPVDMLRYDGCYPATTEDALSLVMDRADPKYREPRTIRLRSRGEGRKGSEPTTGRWSSFMWRVSDVRTY